MNSTQHNVANRIEALTSLRFFAAFVVVSFHYGLATSLVHAAPGIFTAGSEMVTLFFVLSGFVLTLAYAGKGNFSKTDYFVNRLARIAPAYYLALGLLLLFSLNRGLSNIDPIALLLSLTFLQSWVPTYAHTLNIPAWSLSVEMAFYLFFPFILQYALRLRLRNLLWLSLGLWALIQCVTIILFNSAWYQGYPSASNDLLFFFPPMHLCSFLLGICGAQYMLIKSHEPAAQPSQLWAGVRTVGICALTLTVLEQRNAISQFFNILLPFGGSLLSPLFLLLILQLALGQDFWARLLSLPILVVLGQASYSFYILQVPVHRLFAKVVEPHLPQNADIRFWLFVAALCVISILSHKFIEKPAANAVRRFKSKKSSQQTTAAPVISSTTATQTADQ